MSFEIKVTEMVKRVGGQRRYRQYLDWGWLPVHVKPNKEKYHVPSDEEALKRNLEGHVANQQREVRRAFARTKGRKLTAVEKILLS